MPLTRSAKTPYAIHYPGNGLPAGQDALNFYLSQLRVEIEQSFGLLVSTWGILWKPLRVQYLGRGDLVTALFYPHNVLQDEKVAPVQLAEEDEKTGCGRPVLSSTRRTLPAEW